MVALEDVPPFQIWNEVCKLILTFSLVLLEEVSQANIFCFSVAWYGSQNSTWKQVSGMLCYLHLKCFMQFVLHELIRLCRQIQIREILPRTKSNLRAYKKAGTLFYNCFVMNSSSF